MSINKLTESASLKEVMDKFEEISLLDLSLIDVITATELPKTVKNGQIIVITSTPSPSISIYFNAPSSPINGDIWIKAFYEEREKFIIKNKNKKAELNVWGAYQYIGGKFESVNSYIGVDGVWKPMNELALFDEANPSSYSSLYDFVIYNSNYSSKAQIENNYICVKEYAPYGGGGHNRTSYCITKNDYDLSSYKRLYLDYSYTGTNYTPSFSITFIGTKGTTTLKSLGYATEINRTQEEIDISSISDKGKIKISASVSTNGSSASNSEIHVYNLRLE